MREAISWDIPGAIEVCKKGKEKNNLLRGSFPSRTLRVFEKAATAQAIGHIAVEAVEYLWYSGHYLCVKREKERERQSEEAGGRGPLYGRRVHR